VAYKKPENEISKMQNKIDNWYFFVQMVLTIAAVVPNGECHGVVSIGVGANLSSTTSSVCYHIPNRSCPASMRVEVIIT